MSVRTLWMSLCLLGLALPAPARELRNCATPSSSFRHYHPVGGTGSAGAPTTVYDELSFCRTASGFLSFSVRIVGDGGDLCYLEGQAKPRQPGVFVYLSGEFRLRIQVTGDRVEIVEESTPAEGRKFCSGSAAIGAVEFRRRAE